ncbi:rRNA maturation RNase YbeY [Patescibacteria group bacterium]|nr:rRNA maturation RNase YbeY [Patescibacteria group bacterium]
MFSLAQYKKLVKYFPRYIKKRLPKEVAVINISAKESRRLNRLYRKKNKPTNVLSFRYGKDYGEILLCSEVIKKEAKQAGNSQNKQMTWMLIHAMLHLGGVHHENGARQEKRFAKLEGLILKCVLAENSKFKIQKSK